MTGIIYIMKSKTNSLQTKFGHRTKLSAQEVRDKVNKDYPGFECLATYNLGDINAEDTEFHVKQIRIIINTLAGKLEDDQPEYYNIEANKVITILKAISMIRGNPKDIIEM